MSDEPLVVLDNVLWVPTSCIDDQPDKFTYKFETVTQQLQSHLPAQCSSCAQWNKRWRPGKRTCADLDYTLNDVCDEFFYRSLPVREEFIVKTWKEISEDWTIFARGDLGKIEELFGHLGINDQRSAPPLDFNLRCRATLYPYQQKVVNRWVEHGYGLLKAPTGWGKTVTWAWIVAHLGMRTLLLAQERRHLNVAWEGLHEHTDIAEIEAELGEKLVGRLNFKYKITGEDPETGLPVWRESPSFGKHYPITVSTFQAFTSKRGKKLRKKLKNYFGLVWCEEAHHESAATYHKVTKSFNPFYRGGQTATPTRKDKTHVAIYDTLGPVTARGTKEAMTPIVSFHNTNVFVPDSCFKFQYPNVQVINHLARNAKYREILLEKVLAEIEEGRKVLVITERVAHGLSLMEKIKVYGYTAVFEKGGQKKKKDEKKQSWYAEQLMLDELHCIIGTKVLNENWDVPPLDSLHLPFPSFSKEIEEQRVGRVRRPMREKQRKFVEEHGIEWEKPQPRVHVYTWTCNDDSKNRNYAGAAVGFREKLFRKWGFDFDSSVDTIETKKKQKTMKDLMGDDDDD
jgi:superfamily II DNA or RNA helicase